MRAEDRLRPYVPGFAVEWLRTSPASRHRSVDGTLAVVDVSGFTRLTERLAVRGKVGAEEMTGILDRYARDGTIALWDRVTGKKVRTFAGHSGPTGHLAISPDGRRLAAVQGGVFRLWDVDSGRELLAIQALVRRRRDDLPLAHEANPGQHHPAHRGARLGGVHGSLWLTTLSQLGKFAARGSGHSARTG